jgi:hypothetical protein
MGLASKAARLGALSGGLATTVALIAMPVAHAKATYASPYGYARTWNAALRFVRVDRGWKITEKDEGSGYLLFEYTSPENRKPSPASVELVRGPDTTVAVGVVIEIPQMPQYHEQVVLDALAAKMRREYGDTPPSGRRAPPDDGTDGGATPDAD